jgi:hypothetical protein
LEEASKEPIMSIKQEKEWRHKKRQYYAEIERQSYHEERGRARAQWEFRENDRVRRQNERDQREHMKNLNKMFEVPQVNENAFFPDAPNKKKKKRSMFDF